jgi:hypothetical protein
VSHIRVCANVCECVQAGQQGFAARVVERASRLGFASQVAEQGWCSATLVVNRRGVGAPPRWVLVSRRGRSGFAEQVSVSWWGRDELAAVSVPTVM